jgi:hypothetical protein
LAATEFAQNRRTFFPAREFPEIGKDHDWWMRRIVSDHSRAALICACHCYRPIWEGSCSACSCARPCVEKSTASPQIATGVIYGFI